MFLGQYRHNIDEKGRIIIPAKFRDELRGGGFITQDFDKNLRLLTVPAFEALYEKVSQMNTTDPAARQLQRLIFANANFVQLDRIGRILIPQYLRQVAGLEAEGVIVGVGKSIEIWAPQYWEEQVALLQDAEANAQRFSDLDLSLT